MQFFLKILIKLSPGLPPRVGASGSANGFDITLILQSRVFRSQPYSGKSGNVVLNNEQNLIKLEVEIDISNLIFSK